MEQREIKYEAIGETDKEIIHEVKETTDKGIFIKTIKIPKSFILWQKIKDI